MSIEKLTERIHYMKPYAETDRPILAMISGTRASLMLDAGNSNSHCREFLKECQGLGQAPIRYLVLTHEHFDHIFGMNEIEKTTGMKPVTLTSHGVAKEVEALKVMDWSDQGLMEQQRRGQLSNFAIKCIQTESDENDRDGIGSVDIRFQKELRIDLGDLFCELFVIGGPHNDHSVAVYVPEEKALFLGDAVYGRYHDGVYGFEKKKLKELREKISQHPADHFIISHEEVMDRSGILEFLDDLEQEGPLF